MKIGKRRIGNDNPVYFIAEIGSNFDGSFSRAIDLIHLAAENGADAVKFQHYEAQSLVSSTGFEDIDVEAGHQKKWASSVYDNYEAASLNAEWTKALAKECEDCNVHFFTSAYSFNLVDIVAPFVPAYKIGSGDITWLQLLEHIAKKNKPVILATGAADIEDVARAHDAIKAYNNEIVILQCNTNYENSKKNFKHLNLNVLKTYAQLYPDAVLGLSDHTKNYVSTLGAIALGAKVVEKHFTDDDTRKGPDHGFALTPNEWKEMVDRSRELEFSMGTGVKKVEPNEHETIIVQRRSIRAARDLEEGSVITQENVEMLRPCSSTGLEPFRLDDILGKKINRALVKGEEISEKLVEPLR